MQDRGHTVTTCACSRREDADRLMWLAIRRGLLALVKAIELRYGDGRTERVA